MLGTQDDSGQFPCIVDPRNVLGAICDWLESQWLFPVIAVELEPHLIDSRRGVTGPASLHLCPDHKTGFVILSLMASAILKTFLIF